MPTIFVIAAMFIVVNMGLTWIATKVQVRLVGERTMIDVGQVAGTDAATGRAAGGGRT